MNLGGPELVIMVLVLLVGVLPIVLILAFVSSSQRRVQAPSGFLYTGLAAPLTGGQWYADPTGRFPQRWWDGTAWTQQVVIDSGQQTTDPTPLPVPPPAPPAACTRPAAEPTTPGTARTPPGLTELHRLTGAAGEREDDRHRVSGPMFQLDAHGVATIEPTIGERLARVLPHHLGAGRRPQ